MRARPAVAAVLVALSLVIGAPAMATTMQRLDTRALTRGSSDVVIGVVERVEPRWDEKHRRIFTDITLRVTRSLKGAPVGPLRLSQLGGELDGIKYTVHASPVFVPGQEALVFVWRDAKGRAQVNGLAQGKFDIRREASTGRPTVQRTVPGFAVRNPRTLSAAAGTEAAPRIGLDEMIGEIERALAEEGGR